MFLKWRNKERRRKKTPRIADSCDGANYQIVVTNRQDKKRLSFYSNIRTGNGDRNGGTSFAGFLIRNTFYSGAVIAFVRFSGLAGNAIALQHRYRSTTVL